MVDRHMSLTGLSKWLLILFTGAGVAATVFHVFRLHIADRVMLDSAFLALMLGMFLPPSFLVFGASKGAPRHKVPWYDFVLAGLSVLGPAFVFINALPLTVSTWAMMPPPIAVILGVVTWVLVLEAARRTAGLELVIVAGLFSVYPLFASYLPGFLFAKSYPFSQVVGFHFLTTQSIFGLALEQFGKLIVGFMVFGAAMDATGASRLLINLAQAMLRRARGGTALVSVLASSFMAMLSGSPIANVLSIGVVTIPAMKKAGYSPAMAAALEAVASNGGQLMPPVMGATAFIMAALLQIPYAVVALAAFLPMFVYYAGLFAQVYLHAQKHQMPAWEDTRAVSFRKTLVQSWFVLGAVAILVYLLFWIKVEAWAPYYAAAFLILYSFVRKETRPNRGTFALFMVKLGHLLAFLAPIMGATGLILGGLWLTGVAQSLASDLLVLSQGNLYALLLMGAAGSFVLGLGLSATPCYLFMALIFAPSLIKLGIYPVAAHLFFLYWGMLSNITPPVATAVFAACSLAGSPVSQTGWLAVRLAIIIYIIPFVFVLNPALLAEGSLLSIVQATGTALLAGLLTAAVMQGYLVRIGDITVVTRVLFSCSAALLFFGPGAAQAVGAAIAILAITLGSFGLPVFVSRRLSAVAADQQKAQGP